MLQAKMVLVQGLPLYKWLVPICFFFNIYIKWYRKDYNWKYALLDQEDWDKCWNAKKKKMVEIAQILIEHGADVNSSDN